MHAMPMYTIIGPHIISACMHLCLQSMYYSQVTISRQISQRYRNTRRRSADVIRKPRIQLQLHPSTAASSSGCAAIEDDEENVQALQKLEARQHKLCRHCFLPQGSID